MDSHLLEVPICTQRCTLVTRSMADMNKSATLVRFDQLKNQGKTTKRMWFDEFSRKILVSLDIFFLGF